MEALKHKAKNIYFDSSNLILQIIFKSFKQTKVMLLHLHCLLFGVLGWVSVQHFLTSADVRRAL
jgi:hypothetical protein